MHHGILINGAKHGRWWMDLEYESIRKPGDRLGFSTKALGSNRDLAAKQRGAVEWKLVWLD